MKKFLLPLLAFVFIISCGKESTTDLLPDQEIEENGSVTLRSPAPKIDVCHYDDEYDTWEVITVSENAWPAHEGHGDVQLIDEDGDGYVTSENECGLPVDCDDTDAELTDNCSTTCVEGELELTLPNGDIIYVHPNDQNSSSPPLDGITWDTGLTDIPDLTNYDPVSALEDFDGKGNTNKIYAELTTNQQVSFNYAAKRCKELSTETGCDWYLPALGELKAIYDEYANTPEKRTDNNFTSNYYWSSTEKNGDFVYEWVISSGYQGTAGKNLLNGGCRCVRR